MIDKLKKLFGMKNKEKDLQVEAYNENNPPIEPDHLDENFDGREEHYDASKGSNTITIQTDDEPSQHDLDVQSREEAEAAADNIDKVEEPADQYADDPNLEVQMNQDEAETKEETPDDGYLENGTEILGYENREEQFKIYSQVADYIEGSTSILDFGCGRGDLYSWWQIENQERPNYLGIDFNGPLVEAGKKVNKDVKIEHKDWFDIDRATFREWCININSFTSRADGNIASDDLKYVKDSIRLMYDHCTEGCVIILPDTIRGKWPENYMNIAPGALLEFILDEISPAVAFDHAYAYDLYTIIIYKTN